MNAQEIYDYTLALELYRETVRAMLATDLTDAEIMENLRGMER